MLPLSLVGILGTTQSGPNPKRLSPKLSEVLSSGPLTYIPTPSHSWKMPPQSTGEPPSLSPVIILKMLDIAMGDCQAASHRDFPPGKTGSWKGIKAGSDLYSGTGGYRKNIIRTLLGKR